MLYIYCRERSSVGILYILGKRKVSQKVKKLERALCLLSKYLSSPVVNF